MAKYSKGAQKGVESAMKRMEKGKLRSGRSGKKVSNPKQAIAIGLSEARKKGAKVPKKKTAKKSAAKKTTVKRSAAKKTAVKKSGAKKSAVAKKRAAPKKKATSRKASPKKGAAKKKTAKKAVKKTAGKKAGKAAPKKRASADTVPANKSANLRSATAENETPLATNHVQTEMLQPEDPMRKVDQHAFDKFTSKGDPRQKLRLSSKPKSGVKPSGKKPLWN